MVEVDGTIISVTLMRLKAVQSFYVDSRACVRMIMDVSEWFPVNVGLRQGCLMSLSFLMYICYIYTTALPL